MFCSASILGNGRAAYHQLCLWRLTVLSFSSQGPGHVLVCVDAYRGA